MQSRITRLSLAVAVVIAAFIVLNPFHAPIDGSSTAWGSVVEQVKKATSVTYTETAFEGERQIYTAEEKINAMGVTRSESPRGTITIRDYSQGKRIQLNPKNKTAIVVRYTGRPEHAKLYNALHSISAMHESTEVDRTEELNGKTVDVYVMIDSRLVITTWVDPETNLPVQIERKIFPDPNPNPDIIEPLMSLSIRDFGGTENTSRAFSIHEGAALKKARVNLLTNFVWNTDLDPALFSMEVPEGYDVEEQRYRSTPQGYQRLVDALALWTDMSGGVFPDTIKDLADPNLLKPMLIRKYDRDGDPRQELDTAYRQMRIVLQGFSFAQKLKIQDNWHYAGQGVQFGSADTPICWWKLTVDSQIPQEYERYQVIYGDLSVGKASPDNHPLIDKQESPGR